MNSNNIDKELKFLYSLRREGIKLGLQHTTDLLKFLGNPHSHYKTIHIAGTNGKGSTASYISSILIESGYKVGLYTSPHLVKFNERIRVNKSLITDKQISNFINRTKNTIKKIKSTFFESTTAMALDHFSSMNVDVAVIETGLGGRLDSTNIINPDLSIITPISMDHMDILGNNIESIANEKAGIIKNNIPIISSIQIKIVKEILKAKSDELSAPITFIKKPKNVQVLNDRTEFEFCSKKFNIPLIGKFQADNAALAITAIKKFDLNISNEKIKNGLTKVKWAGRLQKIGDKIFYDVSHNEEGVKNTLNTLRNMFPNLNMYGLLCIKEDKVLSKISKQINQAFKKLLVTTSGNGFLMSSKKLSKKLNEEGIKNIRVPSVKSGLTKIKRMKKADDVTLVFGSHYIANELFDEFGISFDRDII